MIVVDLVCEHEHRFEGWFVSSEVLDHQRETVYWIAQYAALIKYVACHRHRR